MWRIASRFRLLTARRRIGPPSQGGGYVAIVSVPVRAWDSRTLGKQSVWLYELLFRGIHHPRVLEHFRTRFEKRTSGLVLESDRPAEADRNYNYYR